MSRTGLTNSRRAAGVALASIAVLAACAGPANAAAWKTTATRLPTSAVERLVPAPGWEVPDHDFDWSDGDRGGFLGWPRGTTNRRASSLVSRSSNNRVGAERTVPHVLEALATDGAGRGIAMTTGDELDRDNTYRKSAGLWATPLGRNGARGAAQQLSTSKMWDRSAIAMNARGDAVVAWLESEPIRLRAAVRTAGKPFTTPVTLAEADPNSPQIGQYSVAISPSGRVLVAYGTNVKGSTDQALAWLGAAGGSIGPRMELGRMTVTSSEEENGAAISAAFDGRGRGFVAWGGPKRRSPVSVTSIAPGSARFAKPITVDRGTDERGFEWAYQGAQLATLDDGGALLAWSSPTGGVRTARFDGRGTRTRVQHLQSAADATVVTTGNRVALVANNPGDTGAHLWLGARDRLQDVGALPAGTPDDRSAHYDFDPSGRFRISYAAVTATGGGELRTATWLGD